MSRTQGRYLRGVQERQRMSERKFDFDADGK